MKAVELTSERLLLKRLTINHLSNSYVSWLNDHEVNKYLETRGNYTIEKLQSFLEDQEKKDIFFWAIHLKDTLEHIGNIKIDPINFEGNSGEYGILMGSKEHWGQGYAKEASQVVINFCFKKLCLSKITLGVIENNVNAVLLYKKLGFNIVECFNNYGVYGGSNCNLVRMDLINKNE
jgi:ribosomal-protein-alanine N-acetyltransferase